MKLDNLTFKDKEALLMRVGRMYRNSVLKNKLHAEFIVQEAESAYINLEVAGEINLILDHMPLDYARIIRQDFLEYRQRGWWKEYYTSSTYYRYKCKAMDTFLDCLYA